MEKSEMTMAGKPVGEQLHQKWRKRCENNGLKKYIMRL
jgi:hypothetical protein